MQAHGFVEGHIQWLLSPHPHLACMPDMASLAVELPTRSLVRLALRHPGSNCALERSCWECLDDCLGRLCFDHYFFAKHHLLGGFCRWFPPSLDPGKAGDGEHACLLQLATGCKRIGNGTALAGAAAFIPLGAMAM